MESLLLARTGDMTNRPQAQSLYEIALVKVTVSIIVVYVPRQHTELSFFYIRHLSPINKLHPQI